jgi:hypothetical protein
VTSCAASAAACAAAEEAPPESYDAVCDATRQAELAAQCQLLREIVGNPFRTIPPNAIRLTPTILTLARSLYEGGALDGLPILADALEEAGCSEQTILDHLRGPGLHCRGCWAVDLVLAKE